MIKDEPINKVFLGSEGDKTGRHGNEMWRGALDGRSGRGRHRQHWADTRMSRVTGHVCTWGRRVPDGENDNSKSQGLEVSLRNSQDAHVAGHARGGEGLTSLGGEGFRAGQKGHQGQA